MMKYSFKILVSAVAACSIIACGRSDNNDPGSEYAPDMYVSKGYEPMTQLQDQKRMVVDANGREWPISADGKNMREPVAGTIARGQLEHIFPYEKTDADYERAGKELQNPLTASEENLAEGKRLYTINCTPCHGESGKGDGAIVAADKYPPPPSYDSDRIRTTPDGKMYFSITYGKNLMGSYASALTPKERWQVIHYIKTLTGTSAGTKTDSTATAK